MAVMTAPPGPQLRIVLPRPGFFIADARLVVTIDGHPVHDGSFLTGMDVCVPVMPGFRRVGTAMELLGTGIWRSREYPIDLSSGRSTTLVLEYSRFWGNFAKTPKLVPW